MKSAGTLVCGATAILQSVAVALPVLVTVAKAEARLPTCTERLWGKLAASTAVGGMGINPISPSRTAQPATPLALLTRILLPLVNWKIQAPSKSISVPDQLVLIFVRVTSPTVWVPDLLSPNKPEPGTEARL